MEFYREGFLNKAGKGLLQTENLLGCIHLNMMESIGLLKHESKAFQITTTTPKRTYYMSGKTEHEVQGWINCIQMAKNQVKTSGSSVPSIYHDLVTSNDVPPKTPTISTSSANGQTPVPSDYQSVNWPTGVSHVSRSSQVESEYAEPNISNVVQYKTVKNTNYDSTRDSDLYDTVSPKEQANLATTKPPPLPARSPLMSGSNPLEGTIEDKSNSVERKEEKSVNEYDVVRTSDALNLKKHSSAEGTDKEHGGDANNKNSVSTLTKLAPHSTEGDSSTNDGEVSDNVFDEYHDETLYDEIRVDDGKEDKTSLNVEKLPSLLEPDLSELYTKPTKITGIRRERSKKKLIPGLMDVGEVDVEVEEEFSEGKDTLKRGMTTPSNGKRFAIEEMREFLAESGEKTNNNDEALPDLDLLRCDSAFDALKKLLKKYETQ
ncbi:protein daughter of sevenless-like isoform X2 [Xenia sp. Carnegie-2017]|uniref:protein daughter of sevenless-like isoform X2 n=1 Tax=Xenia sp. Carnegie-2017 TaxID=2897299 RepID=UPI001F036DA3|nr:protein daughter of sevenless-like isoform X2 [Xenia sp. Carnegie-2017]